MALARKLLAALMLACPVAAHATACPTGYSYVKSFVIAAQPSVLTTFPVALPFNGAAISGNFTLSDLKGTGSGGLIQSTSGFDIVFCDAASSGTLLNFERANYSTSTGLAEFWVSRTLSNSATTTIYMFYGKAADTDHSSAAAVWSAANYVFVQHYGTSSSLVLTDSTGSLSPTNHSATAIAGTVTGGVNVASASSQYIDAGGSVNQSVITVELWANPTSVSGCNRMLSNFNPSSTGGYEFYMGAPSCGSNTTVAWQVANGGSLMSYTYGTGISLGNWVHVAATQTGNTPIVYVNGSASSPTTTTGLSTIANSSSNLNVGRWSGGASNYFNGSVDEIRIANLVQSAAWESANYQTQHAASTFASMQTVSTAQPVVRVITKLEPFADLFRERL